MGHGADLRWACWEHTHPSLPETGRQGLCIDPDQIEDDNVGLHCFGV